LRVGRAVHVRKARQRSDEVIHAVAGVTHRSQQCVRRLRGRNPAQRCTQCIAGETLRERFQCFDADITVGERRRNGRVDGAGREPVCDPVFAIGPLECRDRGN
jgi:hypothetical protein